jgi:hypothetical protein
LPRIIIAVVKYKSISRLKGKNIEFQKHYSEDSEANRRIPSGSGFGSGTLPAGIIQTKLHFLLKFH